MSVTAVTSATITSISIYLVLILYVLAFRNRIAEWLLVAATLIGLWPYTAYIRIGIATVGARFDIVVAAMQLVAIALLFTPSARAWLAGRDREAVDDGLHDTFE
jgi:hypothetical protein